MENSLDAGATAIGKLSTRLDGGFFSYAYTDVRFKSNGLDSIEVQDNGAGISNENFETVGKIVKEARCPATHRLNSLETLHVKTYEL